MERRQEQQEEEEQNKAGNLDALSNRQIFDTRAAFRYAALRCPGGSHGGICHSMYTIMPAHGRGCVVAGIFLSPTGLPVGQAA